MAWIGPRTQLKFKPHFRFRSAADVEAWCAKNGGELGLKEAIANRAVVGTSAEIANTWLSHTSGERDASIQLRATEAAESAARSARWAIAISIAALLLSVAAYYRS